MKTISIGKSKMALVDNGDYERVSGFHWNAIYGRNGKWYAVTHVGRSKAITYLHRFIINAPDGKEVDHKNGDSLDCRRDNLRLATRSQNNQNHPRRRNNTSGFKGVMFCPTSSKANPWRARIDLNGQQFNLGYYPTARAAAEAYDAKAIELFGEFARPNFPVSNLTD